jgi:hypothetical protein
MRNTPLRGFMKSPLKQKLVPYNGPKVNAFATPDFTKLGKVTEFVKDSASAIEKVTPKTVSSESNSRANENRQKIINKQTNTEPTTRGSKGVGGGQYRETS